MRCPKCGHDIRDTAKFCDECGTGFLSTGIAAEPLPEPTKTHLTPEPERKHVTALFSDLSGYTSMTEKLDPEQVKEITSRIFSGVKQIVAKYEGFIERVMGDGCLAFFGIPRAHEDDPIRAIHAAIEIHELVKGLNPQYEARVGFPLTMHSGINSGLVVTADVDPEKGTHGVAGDAVNVASRLSSMAGPGEILVGEETVRRAQGGFVFDDLGRRQAKGKAEPIAVFNVVSVKPHSASTRVDRQVSSEMVGRDRELDLLEFQVMKAIHGEGSVVNVVGEAGIGKSRLIAELKKREVMKRVTLLEGRAISIGKNLSFYPLIDLLKQWAGIAETDSEAAAFDKLEKAIRAVHPEETNEILPFVATLMGMKLIGKHAERVKGIEGEAVEKLIFKNVRELVIKGADLRPTVVVMEDLHWADTTSIELLSGLYRLAEKHRIAFINVFRPGYFRSDDGSIAKMGKLLPASYVEIEVQPLDNANSETLVNNMLAIKGLPYSIRNQIVDRAGGNPFFIEEVVRSLIDEGAVVKRDGGFEVTEKIDKVVIPPTINDVLMARIDRLEERTRELVKVASVIGRSFFDRIIREVADSIEDVDDRLAYLKDVQLIRDRMRMEELEYLFKHALAQEAAYESTLIQQRKALHLKVAQSIEKIFHERLHEFYGMLAYHYSKGEDLEKAEEYMTRAGEEALRSSASSEALDYIQQALKLYVDRYGAKADPEKLTAFKKNLALAHLGRGHMGEALLYFEDVLSIKGYGYPRSRFAQILRAACDLLAITALLYSPLGRKTRMPHREELEDLDLRIKRGQCAFGVDPWRWVAETFSFTRLVLGLDLSKISQGLQWASFASAPFIGLRFYPLGKKMLKRASPMITDETPRGRTVLECCKVGLSLFEGSWNTAPDLDLTVVDLGLRSGDVFEAGLYPLFQGMLRVEQGIFDQADLCARTMLSIADRYDDDFARAYYHRLQVIKLVRIGAFEQASAECEIGSQVAHQSGLKPMILAFLGTKAIAQALLGNFEESSSAVAEGAPMLGKGISAQPNHLVPFLVGTVMTHLGLLQKALQGGSRSDIARQQKTAYVSAGQAVRESKKYAPYRTWILRLMGDYYWLVGKQRKAMKWYDRSIKEGERLGARPDLSRTYFELGRRLLEPQSRYKLLNGIDARGYLEKAEKLFKEMGLEHDLDELERVRSEM